MGLEAVELDYHHSKDQVPVVIHDATLDRTTDARKKWGGKRIRVGLCAGADIQTLDAGSWFEPDLSGTKVPLLSEALDLICGKGAVAVIERKYGDASTLAGLLRQKRLINRVVVISFDWKFLREFHGLEPAQILGALGPPTRLADGRRARHFSKALNARWLALLIQTGAQIVVWNRRVSKPAIRLVHQRNLRLWIYTLNNPSTARRLVQAGVDGLITDQPKSLMPMVAGRTKLRV